MAAKRHKTHKNNYLHIGISDSYRREKYEFGLFTRPSTLNPDFIGKPLNLEPRTLNPERY
jgi:hypothetical protein